MQTTEELNEDVLLKIQWKLMEIRNLLHKVKTNQKVRLSQCWEDVETLKNKIRKLKK